MIAISLNRLHGIVLLINTLLPVVLLLAFIFILNTFAAAVHRDACDELTRIAGNLNKIDSLKKSKQLEKYYLDSLVRKTPTTANQMEKPPQNCVVSEKLSDVLSNGLYARTKTNIHRQIKSVGKKVDGVEKAIGKIVPKVPNINLKKINLPTIKLAKLNLDINKPINTVISMVNSIDDGINSALSRLSNGMGRVLTRVVDPERERIYLEIEKTAYRQAVFWSGLKRFINDFIEHLGIFYWFFVAVILWLVVSYGFWAYVRIRRSWQLIKSGQPITTGSV